MTAQVSRLADAPKKLFRVTLEIEATVVVLAADEDDARRVAKSEIGDIMDEADQDISVGEELTSLQDLPHGWTRECSPYAYYSRDQKPLCELLPESTEPAPEVDDRTIDMFTGKALVDG